MANPFFKINKIIKIFVLIFLFAPIFNINAIESSSTSYIINNYDLDTGNQSNSTNFSISGSLSQGQRGYFSSASLPLVPGVITSCGKITTSGTYTLGSNLIGVPGTCFLIQANNVTIDGAGYSITASGSNSSYAVVATSTQSAGSAYATTTIQNITFSGFSGGVNASGNNASSGNTNGGNGGHVIVSSSTLATILTSGGQGFGTGSIGNGANVTINNSTTGNVTNAGSDGFINISGTNINISNNTYTTSNTLNISYSGTLTTTSTTISALQHFIIQGVDHGSFIGGSFPLFPGNIDACGSLYFSGTYTFSGNITGSCDVLNTGVTINGNGYTLTGNITANNHGATLSDIDVTGIVSTTGAGAGALTVNNSSNLTGTISVTGAIAGDGSSSLSNTTIASGGSVATSSVSFVADVINNGTINSGNTVLGKVTNNSVINTASTFTFNASSTNTGTINGNALFSASSTSTGTINGNATFNAFTATAGEVSFSGTTSFAGIGYISGNVYDSTGTNIITTWVFNTSSTNTGILKGNAIFNDTSRNTISGTVQGNATFNGSSLNLGIVTGNSNVYSPVVRPLTGTTNGQVVYHDYDGLYFNDVADGHGTTGKWDDINNWWLNASSTIHSPIIPTEGDDTIILFGNISTTTAAAHIRTIVFQGSTNNGITITVESEALDAALFNASSTNSGTIVGNATFSGPDTENTGTVTGFITRQYNAGTYVVLRDFTHNGVHWIVEAINGATVDLTGATYSLITNIFKALNNATFIWNNLIGAGAPDLLITSPTTGTNIKWKPVVSWSTSNLCQYKIDAGVYTSVNCSLNGSDIPRPGAGSHTIFFRSTDAGGNIAEKSVLFTYDNTQAVDTDCSTPLDEVTRPYYYLTANVGNCSITATTTLRGDDNGGGHFYSIGSISGNSNDIILQNITATGTVSGFKNMTISSSTLNIVDINGTFDSDSQSTFGNTVVNNTGTVNSGNFIGTLLNNGTIVNSTTTPVTVLGDTTNNGTINNGFILNASSTNTGTINGTTTLNAAAKNQGTVNGNLIYNTLTAASNIVTFSDSTNFPGTNLVTGNILDNRGELITTWSFTGLSSNAGYTKGDVFFNGSSINLGTVTGKAHFSDSSTNSGTVQGNAYKYNATYTNSALGGTVNGSITYYSYPNSVSFRNISGDNDWNNISNWFAFAATTTPLERVPVSGEKIVLFASTTLKNSITNDLYIAMSSSTLNGANYTLTGNIYGNGAYGGHRAYDFNLESITVTGTTTAIGGDGTPDIDGGDGGYINVLNSSTGVITVNGGDPLHNGGDAGAIYVYNTIAIADGTLILAVGGDSVGCGFGGSGGNVSLVDSSGYVLVTDPGTSATATVGQGGNCIEVPVGNPGSAGQVSVVGRYTPPATNNTNNNVSNNVPQTYSSTVPKIKKDVERIIPIVDFAIKLSSFKLKPLPVFGDGTKGTFSFGAGLKSFFKIPISENILNKFRSSPGIFASLGIKSMNDLVSLSYKPAVIKNPKTSGLFTVYPTVSVSPVSYIHFNLKRLLYQSVTLKPGEKVVVTLTPTIKNSKYKGKFNNKDIYFTDNKVVITTPFRSGTYTLTTSASPIPLDIKIINTETETVYTSNIIVDIIKSTFNIFKNIFKFR